MTPRVQRFAVCGAGFIGRSLIDHLLMAGHDVNVLDHKGIPPDLVGRVTWSDGEFANRADLERTLAGVDVAFHLISSTVPGDVDVDPIAELSENMFSTIAFLDVCTTCNVKRVVFVSSSSVYGLQQSTPIREDAQTNPISSHGIQKLTIEKYLLLYQFHRGIDVRIVQLANPFGPGQALYGRQGFVALAIGQLLRNEPILLRDAGRPIRDFIYIDDVSRALVLAAVMDYAPAIINIGSGVGHSLQQVIDVVRSVVGHPIATVAGELRKAEIPVSVLDVERARECLGFVPRVSLSDGLALTVRHHRSATPVIG